MNTVNAYNLTVLAEHMGYKVDLQQISKGYALNLSRLNEKEGVRECFTVYNLEDGLQYLADNC